MIIKLDLEKAYDRLEWNFINETLDSAGFPFNIINLVMNCLNSASLCINWNGE